MVEAQHAAPSAHHANQTVQAIAKTFAHQATITATTPYGSGNVNDTYLVQLSAVAPHIGSDRFVLQRVNKRVFHRPELILMNMRTFLDHIEQRLRATNFTQTTQRNDWCVPRIIPTLDNADVYEDEEQEYWRAITLIEGAKTYHRIRNAQHARESGYALGRFHNLLSDLAPSSLHDTLPGFHITPQYLASFDQVLQQPIAAERQRGVHSATIAAAIDFIDVRRQQCTVLEDAAARGELRLRSIHGDPKVDNILIDDKTDHAISMIDLDTVKPGLVHYDIGDALRSCCNPAGEETADLMSVQFDIELCKVILEGYLAEAAGFFTDADYAYIYDSIRLIAFELGLRFFSDYLAGDVYFKVRHPEHNLQRARVQFRLVESIEAQEQTIRQLITQLRR